MSEPEKATPLVDETGKATSPFAKWPGHIKFPEVMGLREYRIFVNHRDTPADEKEDDALKVLVRLEEGPSGNQTVAVKLSDLALAGQIVEAVELGDVNLWGDNPPIILVHWVIECIKEWLNGQLTFRIGGNPHMESQAE